MMKMYRASTLFGLGILGVGILLGSGCQSLKGNKQAKLQEVPKVQVSTLSPKIAWRNKAPHHVGQFSKLMASFDQGKLFVADKKGQIMAIDSQSGKVVWKVKTDYSFSAGPSVSGNQIFIGTLDAQLVSLNKQNGTLLWTAKVPSEVLSSPKGNQDLVLVHTIDGKLSAYEAKTGQKKWVHERQAPSLTLRAHSTPALVNDLALIGFANGQLVALNKKNGVLEWEQEVTQSKGRTELHRMVDISSDVLIDDDLVYVVTYQGNVSAYQINSGTKVWQKNVSAYQNMTTDDQALYITDKDYALWALDKKTGLTLWKQEALKGRKITGPAVNQAHVFVADPGGVVHWVNKHNGVLQGNLALGGGFYFPPITGSKMTMVQSKDGTLTALTF